MEATQEEKDRLLAQLDKCDTEAWTALMRYCASELVNDQVLLAEIVCREAERRAEDDSGCDLKIDPHERLSDVLMDIGLELVKFVEAA